MLTSHYMQDIEALCHRVIIIDHGKIFFDGPLSAIIDRFSGHKIISLTFEDRQARDFSDGSVRPDVYPGGNWRLPLRVLGRFQAARSCGRAARRVGCSCSRVEAGHASLLVGIGIGNGVQYSKY